LRYFTSRTNEKTGEVKIVQLTKVHGEDGTVLRVINLGNRQEWSALRIGGYGLAGNPAVTTGQDANWPLYKLQEVKSYFPALQTEKKSIMSSYVLDNRRIVIRSLAAASVFCLLRGGEKGVETHISSYSMGTGDLPWE